MAAKLGILAGGGALPICLAEHCERTERAFHVIVLEDQGEPADFAAWPHDVLRLGAAGKAIKVLKKQGCEALVMAGSVKRPSLSELRPDWWAVKFFAKTGAQNLGDDGLLSALIEALGREGFEVFGADDFVSDLLAAKGVLGAQTPSADNEIEIKTGMSAARQLGAEDIGQAVVARHGDIVATEDADGTDSMLLRLAASDIRSPGGVLVKVLKPEQERRADIPAIGPNTVENAHKAGLSGIAVEAGSAFILHQDSAITRADALGLFIVGVDTEGNWR